MKRSSSVSFRQKDPKAINTASIAHQSPSTIAVPKNATNIPAFADGELAVFQGASEGPISVFIWVERATRENSQLAPARRVAMKMGPRLSRGRGIGYVSI